MLCPKCGFDNREEARFCARCGTDLQRSKETAMGTEALEAEETSGEGTREEEVAEPISPKIPEPLPEGALVGGRRYEIQKLIRSENGVNEYLAVETEPRKRCPNPECQTTNSADSNFCEHCGSDLSGAELVSLSVRLLESFSSDRLEPFWTLAEREIHHPAIAAPFEAFSEAPYDERAYIALPEITGTPLGQVEPEDAATVLIWARLLSEAFAQLAREGLGLKEPLATAVLFTDQAEPFLLPTAIAVKADKEHWDQVRHTFAQQLERWLQAIGEEQWIAPVREVLSSETDWQKIAVALQQLWERMHLPPVVRLALAAATDVGQRREHNEDSYLVWQIERCHLDRTETLALLVVADGMGGHAAGEVASKLCLQVFATHLLPMIQDWLNFHEPNWRHALMEAVHEANRQVFAEAQAMRNNMGTTLTAALIVGDKVLFANVGDSRGYMVQNGQLRQITKDHSLVQRLVDAGLITPEEARWHPQRNIITQAIGLDPNVTVDLFEVPLRPGDLVLLCSDGLVDMVDDVEIERVLLSELDLSVAVQTLIRLANEAGGDDNITVVLARSL